PVYIPGEDATPRNLLTDAQFATVGGAYRDPFTTSGAQVDNPDQPTRTLKPLEQRFSITGYTHSDHNPVRVRFSISDPNGNASFDPATWQIRLDDILPGGASLVLPQAGVADPANAYRLKWIYTHGYDVMPGCG
ncbi:MAG: hypothetical protein GXO54_03075, partial [Chloroflexi bacterium]|nr:hypothetical protein [Chloroflexota bacterium]